MPFHTTVCRAFEAAFLEAIATAELSTQCGAKCAAVKSTEQPAVGQSIAAAIRKTEQTTKQQTVIATQCATVRAAKLSAIRCSKRSAFDSPFASAKLKALNATQY